MNRDVTVDNEGSIFIVTPHTQEAKDWVAESIASDHQEWCGGVVVESRYVVDLVEAMRDAGLTVNS